MTVNDDKLTKARLLIAAGLTVREAAGRVKVGKSALFAAIKAAKAQAGTP